MPSPTCVSSPRRARRHGADGWRQRLDARQPLSTTLFAHEPTLEFTTRLAKLVARRAGLPVYVTNSMSFSDAAMGGTVEEEMEALRSIAGVTLERLSATTVAAGEMEASP